MQLPRSIAAAIENGDTVITSTALSARALRRLYGEAQRSQGREAWQSPEILDWDIWLNRLWQKCLRSGSENRLLLTTLQEQQVWGRLVKPAIEGRRLISVLGVAELAQQAYALLCTYRALDFLNGERVAGPDVESFREWARAFKHTCSREGWLSRSELPLVLREGVLANQVEVPSRLVLTGFDRMTPAQEYLLDALQKFHQVEVDQVTAISILDTPLLVKAVDERDEISICALWAKQELASATTHRIAIVVPNVSSVRPQIESIFRQLLAPNAVAIGERDSPLPFEFSLGVPLENVPMARGALLLLRWMHDPLPQEQLSWLMLSGFLCENQDELLPIAAFDARLRSQFMRQPNQDLDTFLQLLSSGSKEAAPLDALQHRLRIARRILPQDGALNFSEWVTVAERILVAVHWPGAHSMQSEDFQVESRWSHLLDSVAALAFDGRKVSCAEFLEVLEQQAKQTIFAPESRNAPIQILGPLEAAGLTFDALWFLGADDANWPSVARPHPFLPVSLQRKHGMPHSETAADWKLAQQVTLRLQSSAAKSVFSYPAQNAEGLCRPSTLVNSVTKEITSQSFRAQLAGGDDGDQPAALLIDEEPAAIVPWPSEQDAGGSEVLRRQAACPFQSFATKRLSARPMEATDWGLEPRERGSVVHKILEDLWAELKSYAGLMQARREDRLQAIVEHHVKSALLRYGNAPHTRKQNWSQAYLEAEQDRICSLILEWLDYEAKRSPFTVEAGEVKLAATVENLKLQVRVDRIDCIRNGRVIIDYKTGVVKADAWEGERPDEPQLPLYAGFGRVDELQGVLLGRVREGETRFIGRVENADDVIAGDTKLSKPPYRPEMLQAWQRVLLDVGRQFLRGEAQVDPKRYPKTCEFCPLPGLCRIAETDRASGTDDQDDGGTD
jgi:ATP-dependent helicase/nuclease subunit B